MALLNPFHLLDSIPYDKGFTLQPLHPSTMQASTSTDKWI